VQFGENADTTKSRQNSSSLSHSSINSFVGTSSARRYISQLIFPLIVMVVIGWFNTMDIKSQHIPCDEEASGVFFKSLRHTYTPKLYTNMPLEIFLGYV